MIFVGQMAFGIDKIILKMTEVQTSNNQDPIESYQIIIESMKKTWIIISMKKCHTVLINVLEVYYT